ncbi:MAG: hypothetical protein PHV87_07785, partial [Bacilli bacterium]|nr:hypothetical protein [Bacilli bacterium]
MKKLHFLLVLLVVGALFVPAVLAVSTDEVIFDETYQDPVYAEFMCAPSISSSTEASGAMNIMFISASLSEMDEIYSITQCPATYIANYASLPQYHSARVNFTALANGDYIGSGEYGYFKFNVGTAQWLQIYTQFDDMDFSKIPTTSSGTDRAVQIYPQSGYSISFPNGKGANDYVGDSSRISTATTTLSPHKLCFGRLYNGKAQALNKEIKTTTFIKKCWKNRLIVTNETGHIYPCTGVAIIRNIDGISHTSKHIIKDAVNTNIKTSSIDEKVLIKTENRPISIDIQNPTTSAWFNTTIGGGPVDPGDPVDPGTAAVTVYIKNSQTGANIANSNIIVEALVNDEYYEVINKTLSGGQYSGDLQPTGGGLPNPDEYRITWSADGYTNNYEPMNFTVGTEPITLMLWLTPAQGAPENPERAFIDFYVRDLNANPIKSSTIQLGDATHITNNQGYSVFDVPKNTTLTYTVSKPGYTPLEGRVTVGALDRYTVNTVLAPTVTPTTPTPIPTSTSI